MCRRRVSSSISSCRIYVDFQAELGLVRRMREEIIRPRRRAMRVDMREAAE